MKVLSIKQPWAWAIMNAGKDIENRTWWTSHKGPLLIHAGKKTDPEGYLWIQNNMKALKIKKPLPPLSSMEKGGIIGIVMLSGWAINHPSKWAENDKYHWALNDPVAVSFTPYKGQLGLFDFK